MTTFFILFYFNMNQNIDVENENNNDICYENNNNDKNNNDEINYDNDEDYQKDVLILNLINVYQVYHRQLFNKPHNETLFHGIDLQNDTSTNINLEMFYEAVCFHEKASEKYKKLYDDDEYAYVSFENDDETKQNNDDINLYIVKVKNTCKYTYSLISALLFVAEHDWPSCKWSIYKANC
jgi:hypothetical protein